MAADKVFFESKDEGVPFLIHRDDLERILEDYGFSLGDGNYELTEREGVSSEDYAIYLENELENANYHTLAELPVPFAQRLAEDGFSEEQRRRILGILGERLLDLL